MTASHPDHIEKYVGKSLKNAGLESFDLMQFHTWEDDWLEDERAINKMIDLKEQGIVPCNRHQHESLGTMERD